MREIYLVRHGLTDADAGPRRCVGITDVPLSDYGRGQSIDLMKYFQETEIQHVYSSPSARCKAAAVLIAGSTCGFMQVVDTLHEVDCGVWENLTFAEIQRRYPAEYEERGADMEHYVIQNGEAFAAAGKRFTQTVQNLIQNTSGNLVIVAHAGVNRMFIRDALGGSSNIFAIPQPCGGITRIVIDAGRLAVRDVGIMPRDYPDEEACRRLYRKYNVPERVIKHCAAVAEETRCLAAQLSSGHPGVYAELLYAAALLHDIAKGKKDHAREGAAILRREGYPKVADLVRNHHQLACADIETLTAPALLFYADKRVMEDKRVSLQERFAASAAKCKNPEARENHDRQYQCALAVERKLYKTV